jgi:hypothetical protein
MLKQRKIPKETRDIPCIYSYGAGGGMEERIIKCRRSGEIYILKS